MTQQATQANIESAECQHAEVVGSYRTQEHRTLADPAHDCSTGNCHGGEAGSTPESGGLEGVMICQSCGREATS
jgi:hypothetical protein